MPCGQRTASPRSLELNAALFALTALLAYYGFVAAATAAQHLDARQLEPQLTSSEWFGMLLNELETIGGEVVSGVGAIQRAVATGWSSPECAMRPFKGAMNGGWSEVKTQCASPLFFVLAIACAVLLAASFVWLVILGTRAALVCTMLVARTHAEETPAPSLTAEQREATNIEDEVNQTRSTTNEKEIRLATRLRAEIVASAKKEAVYAATVDAHSVTEEAKQVTVLAAHQIELADAKSRQGVFKMEAETAAALLDAARSRESLLLETQEQVLSGVETMKKEFRARVQVHLETRAYLNEANEALANLKVTHEVALETHTHEIVSTKQAQLQLELEAAQLQLVRAAKEHNAALVAAAARESALQSTQDELLRDGEIASAAHRGTRAALSRVHATHAGVLQATDAATSAALEEAWATAENLQIAHEEKMRAFRAAMSEEMQILDAARVDAVANGDAQLCALRDAHTHALANQLVLHEDTIAVTLHAEYEDRVRMHEKEKILMHEMHEAAMHNVTTQLHAFRQYHEKEITAQQDTSEAEQKALTSKFTTLVDTMNTQHDAIAQAAETSMYQLESNAAAASNVLKATHATALADAASQLDAARDVFDAEQKVLEAKLKATEKAAEQHVRTHREEAKDAHLQMQAKLQIASAKHSHAMQLHARGAQKSQEELQSELRAASTRHVQILRVHQTEAREKEKGLESMMRAQALRMRQDHDGATESAAEQYAADRAEHITELNHVKQQRAMDVAALKAKHKGRLAEASFRTKQTSELHGDEIKQLWASLEDKDYAHAAEMRVHRDTADAKEATMTRAFDALRFAGEENEAALIDRLHVEEQRREREAAARAAEESKHATTMAEFAALQAMHDNHLANNTELTTGMNEAQLALKDTQDRELAARKAYAEAIDAHTATRNTFTAAQATHASDLVAAGDCEGELRKRNQALEYAMKEQETVLAAKLHAVQLQIQVEYAARIASDTAHSLTRVELAAAQTKHLQADAMCYPVQDALREKDAETSHLLDVAQRDAELRLKCVEEAHVATLEELNATLAEKEVAHDCVLDEMCTQHEAKRNETHRADVLKLEAVETKHAIVLAKIKTKQRTRKAHVSEERVMLREQIADLTSKVEQAAKKVDDVTARAAAALEELRSSTAKRERKLVASHADSLEKLTSSHRSTQLIALEQRDRASEKARVKTESHAKYLQEKYDAISITFEQKLAIAARREEALQVEHDAVHTTHAAKHDELRITIARLEANLAETAAATAAAAASSGISVGGLGGEHRTIAAAQIEGLRVAAAVQEAELVAAHERELKLASTKLAALEREARAKQKSHARALVEVQADHNTHFEEKLRECTDLHERRLAEATFMVAALETKISTMVKQHEIALEDHAGKYDAASTKLRAMHAEYVEIEEERTLTHARALKNATDNHARGEEVASALAAALGEMKKKVSVLDAAHANELIEIEGRLVAEHLIALSAEAAEIRKTHVVALEKVNADHAQNLSASTNALAEEHGRAVGMSAAKLLLLEKNIAGMEQNHEALLEEVASNHSAALERVDLAHAQTHEESALKIHALTEQANDSEAAFLLEIESVNATHTGKMDKVSSEFESELSRMKATLSSHCAALEVAETKVATAIDMHAKELKAHRSAANADNLVQRDAFRLAQTMLMADHRSATEKERQVLESASARRAAESLAAVEKAAVAQLQRVKDEHATKLASITAAAEAKDAALSSRLRGEVQKNAALHKARAAAEDSHAMALSEMVAVHRENVGGERAAAAAVHAEALAEFNIERDKERQSNQLVLDETFEALRLAKGAEEDALASYIEAEEAHSAVIVEISTAKKDHAAHLASETAKNLTLAEKLRAIEHDNAEYAIEELGFARKLAAAKEPTERLKQEHDDALVAIKVQLATARKARKIAMLEKKDLDSRLRVIESMSGFVVPPLSHFQSLNGKMKVKVKGKGRAKSSGAGKKKRKMEKGKTTAVSGEGAGAPTDATPSPKKIVARRPSPKDSATRRTVATPRVRRGGRTRKKPSVSPVVRRLES